MAISTKAYEAAAKENQEQNGGEDNTTSTDNVQEANYEEN